MKKFISGKVYLSKFMKKEIVLAAINAEEMDEHTAGILLETKTPDGVCEVAWCEPNPINTPVFVENIDQSRLTFPITKSAIFKKRTLSITVWECIRGDQ